MATPITHVVLTQKVFSKYFPEHNKKEFFIGTLFPDIRYLGVIDRSKTHFEVNSVSEIVGQSSFKAGMLFHSYLDRVREDLVVREGIYELMPDSPFVTQALKALEDAFLYSKVQNWSEYKSYLNLVLQDQIAYGILEKDVRKWHTILQNYFENKPIDIRTSEFIQGIGLSTQVFDEVKKVYSEVLENEDVLDYIDMLYSDFDALLEK